MDQLSAHKSIVPKDETLTLTEQLRWLQEGLPDDVWLPIAERAQSILQGHSQGLRQFMVDRELARSEQCSCSECAQLYEEPVRVPPCQHAFCQRHIIARDGKSLLVENCPRCDAQLTCKDATGLSVDDEIKWALADMAITCPLGDCEARVDLADLTYHIKKECEYLPTMCGFDACGAQLVRCTAPLHKQLCKYAPEKLAARASRRLSRMPAPPSGTLSPGRGDAPPTFSPQPSSRAATPNIGGGAAPPTPEAMPAVDDEESSEDIVDPRVKVRMELMVLCGQLGSVKEQINDEDTHEHQRLALEQKLPALEKSVNEALSTMNELDVAAAAGKRNRSSKLNALDYRNDKGALLGQVNGVPLVSLAAARSMHGVSMQKHTGMANSPLKRSLSIGHKRTQPMSTGTQAPIPGSVSTQSMNVPMAVSLKVKGTASSVSPRRRATHDDDVDDDTRVPLASTSQTSYSTWSPSAAELQNIRRGAPPPIAPRASDTLRKGGSGSSGPPPMPPPRRPTSDAVSGAGTTARPKVPTSNSAGGVMRSPPQAASRSPPHAVARSPPALPPPRKETMDRGAPPALPPPRKDTIADSPLPLPPVTTGSKRTPEQVVLAAAAVATATNKVNAPPNPTLNKSAPPMRSAPPPPNGQSSQASGPAPPRASSSTKTARVKSSSSQSRLQVASSPPRSSSIVRAQEIHSALEDEAPAVVRALLKLHRERRTDEVKEQLPRLSHADRRLFKEIVKDLKQMERDAKAKRTDGGDEVRSDAGDDASAARTASPRNKTPSSPRDKTPSSPRDKTSSSPRDKTPSSPRGKADAGLPPLPAAPVEQAADGVIVGGRKSYSSIEERERVAELFQLHLAKRRDEVKEGRARLSKEAKRSFDALVRHHREQKAAAKK